MIWFPPTPVDRQALIRASGGRWSDASLRDAYESISAVVRPEAPVWLSETSRRFLASAHSLDGAEPMLYQRVNRSGRRWLPSEWLPTDNERLKIIRGTVDQVIWNDDTASGVRVVGEDGAFDLCADRGVVIAAGTIATPAILVRSGLGNRDELSRIGVNVRQHIASLGDHLQDHLIMPVIFETTRLSDRVEPQPSMRDLARWEVMGTGPVSSNLAECGGLFAERSIQMHVTPTHYLSYPKQGDVSAMTIGVNVTQPQSSGHLRLISSRADVSPELAPNYLGRRIDLERTIRAIHLARQLAEQPPLNKMIRRELLPGPKRGSAEELTRAISRYAQTLYHPVGTCRLGAVVDEQLAIRGTERLWVVDASILPQLTVGNPNASILMLAWFAADLLKNQIS
jgi:choline dehydrogenase-like flavoprotein